MMNKYTQKILSRATPLHDREGIGPLINSIKNKKIVMLGEASHGTKEYYQWRQHITRELIMNHGFNFVAIEGDWPPCESVNQYIRGENNQNSISVLNSFNRWPTWMWANVEMQNFIEWSRKWNNKNSQQFGIHGLDVYSFYESMDRVLSLLKDLDPILEKKVKEKYDCLASYRHSEKSYAQSLLRAPEGCKQEILDALHSILEARSLAIHNNEMWLDATQNALIVRDAEEYYRAMVFSEEDSWNIRDNHMMSTLEMLLENYGPESKGIVWAHNTHVGDYRATDMANYGHINIGGLAREIFGNDKVALIGFGSYSGTVIASYAWNGPAIVYDIPEARPESVEHACHSVIKEVGSPDFYLLFEPKDQASELGHIRGHRAIGVVYDPDIEHRGNFVPTSLANRYDAFIFLDYTHALTELKTSTDPGKFPETYPHGTRI